jgi:formate dehydrogenase subunit gamma
MTGEIERYTYTERMCHWITGLVYVYCLSTGLAFYTPYLFWMAIALGGAPTSRFWHPIIGVAFFAAQMWMHHLWRSDMTVTASDRKWLDKVESYITNRDQDVPAQGRFNAGQKLYYWAMFYGAFFLLASGLVMWFPEYIPAGLRWLRDLAILIHEASALITIGAFIIHVYMSIFTVPGSVTAMVDGHVSKAWARTHHRLWYDRVAEKTSPPE